MYVLGCRNFTGLSGDRGTREVETSDGAGESEVEDMAAARSKMATDQDKQMLKLVKRSERVVLS